MFAEAMLRPGRPPIFRPLLLVAALALTASIFAAPEKWANEINLYTNTDENDPPVGDATLFVGDSLIRSWNTLSSDFPSTFTINRGFGGAELSDTLYYADRIIIPYHPRIIVLYAGENDLVAGKSPEVVFADFQALTTRLENALSQARILFLAIKESPSRRELHDAILRTNALIAAACARDSRLTFVDVATPLLDAAGKTRPELFLGDHVQLQPAGYAIWTKALTPFLKP